jgi:hypothetical protein
MSKWEKTYTLLLLPVVLILMILEPLWEELKRIHNNGDLYFNYKSNFKDVYNLYTKDIWN